MNALRNHTGGRFFCGLQAWDFVHFFCKNTKKYKNFMKIIRNDIENVLTKW